MSSNVLPGHAGLPHSPATVRWPVLPRLPWAASRLLVTDVNPAPIVRPETREALRLRACLAPQSCPALCDPVDRSPPGSSIHGVLQAGILERVATSFSRDLPDLEILTQGWNADLPHCRQILYHLSHQGSPALSPCLPNLPNESSGNMIPLCLPSDWNSSLASHYKRVQSLLWVVLKPLLSLAPSPMHCYCLTHTHTHTHTHTDPPAASPISHLFSASTVPVIPTYLCLGCPFCISCPASPCSSSRLRPSPAHLDGLLGPLPSRPQENLFRSLLQANPRSSYTKLLAVMLTAVLPSFCHWVVSSHLWPHGRSTLDSSVLHYVPEFAQIHVHRVGDAIQLSHPLSPPSPPAFNLSHHQGLSQWVDSWHQVAKVLDLQLQQYSNEHSGFISFRRDWFDILAI